MLPKVHEHMAAHGLDLRGCTIVPNGIAPEEWAAAPRRCAPMSRRPSRGCASRAGAVVGYAGSMGLPNALDTLLDAAALCATMSRSAL